MSDRKYSNYRGRRYKPVVDPDSYAAIAAVLRHDQNTSRVFGPGYEEIDAPTRGTTDAKGRKRPRAYKCGYNYETQTLVIIMRDKYTWIQYDGVPPEMWENFRDYGASTNEFVQEALLGWPYVKTNRGDLPGGGKPIGREDLPRTKPQAFEDEVRANTEYWGEE